MFSLETILKILGISEKVSMSEAEMVKKMTVSYYPKANLVSNNILKFKNLLDQFFKRHGINVIEYNDALDIFPLKRRLRRFFKYNINNLIWIFRKVFRLPQVSFYIPLKSILKLSGKYRVKKGVCIICLGEQKSNDLPMQYISNFKSNSIVTVIDFPNNIDETSSFAQHFDTAMSCFAYHMTNILIGVDDKKWMIYNFNASHPIYQYKDGNFDTHILKALIPKVVAPISPHVFKDFKISNQKFIIENEPYKSIINDLKLSGEIFSKTSLFPDGKKIDDLPFRENFHRLIGKLHLDNRSGMSFGFLAHQVPTKLSPLLHYSLFKEKFKDAFENGKDMYTNTAGVMYGLLELGDEKYVIEIPEVWVMTLRSGSNKTHFNPKTDMLKMGLKNGEMWMEFPVGTEVNNEYKPSFDTKVILAHAVGNAIIGSIIKHYDPDNKFVRTIETSGLGLAHWHGYFNKSYLPLGINIYGESNLHVSCSSPQSAVYALAGKLDMFDQKIKQDNHKAHLGDIHIEPHHGINVNVVSLKELARYIFENPEATELGNKYL